MNNKDLYIEDMEVLEKWLLSQEPHSITHEGFQFRTMEDRRPFCALFTYFKRNYTEINDEYVRYSIPSLLIGVSMFSGNQRFKDPSALTLYRWLCREDSHYWEGRAPIDVIDNAPEYEYEVIEDTDTEADLYVKTARNHATCNKILYRTPSNVSTEAPCTPDIEFDIETVNSPAVPKSRDNLGYQDQELIVGLAMVMRRMNSVTRV
jgi:hypothetical protein